jgi:putative hemolysin
VSDLWQLMLVVALVLTNGLFAGSEIALISLRPAQLDRLALRGGSGRALARLAVDPNRYLATIQVGITLSGFLASATAAVSLAEPIVPLLAILGDAAEVVAVMFVTVILTFVMLVFGELAPKRVAMQHSEGWAMLVARPLEWLAIASRPAVWLLSSSTNLVVRLAGGDPARQREEVTEEEIRDMISTQKSFTPEERQIIAGALEVGERTLRQVLVPRQSVFALSAAMDMTDALPAIVESGHSRVPIYRTSVDDIFAAVQLRDIVGRTGILGDAAAPLQTLPETASALATLRVLQRARQHMAVVVDEFGGVEGIVTLEDLIEEIVGEIYDEDDHDVSAVVHLPDGSMLLPGSFPAHDLIDLGIDVPAGSFTTVAGVILDDLGHIPTAGESVMVGGWQLTVRRMARIAIAEVHARRVEERPEG